MPDFVDFPNASANLLLPYIQPNQAQKHVTHNEGMQRLDALVQLSVVSADVAQPPAMPGAGLRHIVPIGATGVWSGQEGRLAVFEGGAWTFLSPQPGWTAWVEDRGMHLVHDGADWQAMHQAGDYQNLPSVGVGTSADDTNRLAVAGDATLLSHDGAGHQIKVNKAAASDTASLLFQTDWQGRAEMGTTGSDDFAIKVSADGADFRTALSVDGATGQVDFPQGATGLAPAEFGRGPLLTVDYISSRGGDLVTNGTGILGNTYNYPAPFIYDPVTTPNLPASFSFAGYHPGVVEMTEFLAVDPNQVWRLSCYVRQEKLAGDWSAFPTGESHTQYMGLLCFDLDKQPISGFHHMRFKKDGIDSLTTLTQPLGPGDTVVHLANSAGWNDTASQSWVRGLMMMGYRNAAGGVYDNYSRIVKFSMFGVGAVDKAAHTVTLSSPFPQDMANPYDPSGIWPVGTRIANSNSGGNYKYVNVHGATLAKTGTWYRASGYIGGVDNSATNVELNFPPGTAFVKPFWIPNHSNRPGGSGGRPDTGAAHRVWFAGTSVMPEPLARLIPITSGAAAGSHGVRVPVANASTGAIALQNAARSLEEI